MQRKRVLRHPQCEFEAQKLYRTTLQSRIIEKVPQILSLLCTVLQERNDFSNNTRPLTSNVQNLLVDDTSRRREIQNNIQA